jgi:hypothetical protein
MAFTQPDQRTCGAAVLVRARMRHDPAYDTFIRTGTHPVTGDVLAGTAEERFATEALATHARTNGTVDALGRAQWPWPRALGTPPWGLAREMTRACGRRGSTYDPVPVLHRPGCWSRLAAALRTGHAVPLYTGSRLLPRHVVLATHVVADASGLRVYDPARGASYAVSRDAFTDGRLPGWPKPWFIVVPV